MVTIQQWEMRSPREPLVPVERPSGALAPGETLVRVAGCGLCHTDIGFFEGSVRTNHALPLTLGHEISGRVEEAGPGLRDWVGRAVIVPAILPCGECRACRKGRSALCPKQVFPGNDIHGGFASHVVVPGRFLCDASSVDDDRLADLSVIADAVSTPFEAIHRSGLARGELAIFIGAGGVGGFGVQIAAALGASVVAIDPSSARRSLALAHGAALALDPTARDLSALRGAVRQHAAEAGLPTEEWKVFETSGTTAGQETAFGLLVRGSHLGVVGYAPGKAAIALSRLMALDAAAVGNWGCAPERYPDVLALVASGHVKVAPFIERRPLSRINDAFADMTAHRLERRVVLVPDAAGAVR